MEIGVNNVDIQTKREISSHKHETTLDLFLRIFKLKIAEGRFCTTHCGPFQGISEVELRILWFKWKQKMIGCVFPLYTNKLKVVFQLFTERSILKWIGGRMFFHIYAAVVSS